MQHTFNYPALIKSLTFTSLLIPVISFSQQAEQNLQVVEQSATSTIQTINSKQTSEAKSHLMAKLSKLTYFSATFTQSILSEQGELLQQGSGSLAIKKPNLVNWKTTTPDETLIVSDGNTLWFYDPFIEQASAYSLAKSIHNTPILLLTSDDPLLWKQYNVYEEAPSQDKTQTLGQRFIVTPIDTSSQIKRLTLTFSAIDVTNNKIEALREFSFQDATGQISKISLHNFNSIKKPEETLFSFTLPDGVRLEDNR